MAIVVQHGDLMSRIAASHGAGLGWRRRGAVADEVVHFGLAVHLVDRHPQRLAGPVVNRFAQGFAGAHDAAQNQVVFLLRLRHRLHHHLQRRGEKKAVAHPVLLHQPEGFLRIEAAAIAENRFAEIPGRQQRVEQAAGPGPVGRRPEHVAALRKEIVRADKAGQITEQGSLRHQGALRIAGGAAGVDEQGRIIGGGIAGGVARRGQRQQGGPLAHPGFACAADTDHVFELRQGGARGGQLFQPTVVDDGHPHLGVRQAILERIGAEQMRHRHRNRAHLVAGDVRNAGFRPLRQDDGNAVTGHDAHGAQHIGQSIGGLLEIPEGPGFRVSGLILVVQGEARPVVRPAPAAGLGDVVARRHLPAKRRPQGLPVACRRVE